MVLRGPVGGLGHGLTEETGGHGDGHVVGVGLPVRMSDGQLVGVIVETDPAVGVIA